MPSSSTLLKNSITHKAHRLGFDAIGFTQASLDISYKRRLETFIEQGRHGSMHWLAERLNQRSSPQNLWPEAISVISLGMNYGPDHNPLSLLGQKQKGLLSVYAQNRDYHDLIKGRLKELGQFILKLARQSQLPPPILPAPSASYTLTETERLNENTLPGISPEVSPETSLHASGKGRPKPSLPLKSPKKHIASLPLPELRQPKQKSAEHQLKVFVDTAPVMEKPLAQQAGLGWQGKHTNLVSRHYGSWLLLGEIFTTLPLPPDIPHKNHCGSCQSCMDICPTSAITSPYQLDARRCISYLTIEFDGPIPAEFRTKMGNRIYGCDDCLAICPWNRFAQQTRQVKLQSRPELKAPELKRLAELDEPAFRLLFSGSPVKRIGYKRFMRNVLLAIGNSRQPALLEKASLYLYHPDPVLADAAQWSVFYLQHTCYSPPL